MDVMAPFSSHRPLAMCLRTTRIPSSWRAQPEYLPRMRPRWASARSAPLPLFFSWSSWDVLRSLSRLRWNMEGCSGRTVLKSLRLVVVFQINLFCCQCEQADVRPQWRLRLTLCSQSFGFSRAARGHTVGAAVKLLFLSCLFRVQWPATVGEGGKMTKLSGLSYTRNQCRAWF